MKKNKEAAKAARAPSSLGMSQVPEILGYLHKFRQEAPGVQHLTPALYGETGTGKTTSVRRYAESRGLPTRTLLMHSMLPEQVLGLPRVDADGRTFWTIPEWLSEEPMVLLLDEMDKVPRDVCAATLTLLADRRIREHELHRDADIIVAMQPVEPDIWLADQTGKAMEARLVFLPMSPEWSAISRQHGVDLSFIANREVSTPAGAAPPSPRKIIWTVAWIRWARAHKVPADIVELIAAGAVGPDLAGKLLDAMRDVASLSESDFVAAVNADPIEVINALAPAELVRLYPIIAQRCTPTAFRRALERLFCECGPDEVRSALEAGYNRLLQQAKAEGSATLCGEASAEDVRAAIEAAARVVYEEYSRRGKQKEAKG